MGIRKLILQVCRELKETVCGRVPRLEFIIGFPSAPIRRTTLSLPRPKEETQLRSLNPGTAHCFRPRVSPSILLGHTWKAKTFPKAEVMKQKKTKLFFQSTSLVGYEQSHLSVASLPLGKGVAGKPGRTGLAQMVLLSTTVIQVIWTKSGKLLLPDSPSSGYGTLGTSVRQDGTGQSQDSHLKL